MVIIFIRFGTREANLHRNNQVNFLSNKLLEGVPCDTGVSRDTGAPRDTRFSHDTGVPQVRLFNRNTIPP